MIYDKSKEVQAWHFVNKTLRDGRPIPPDGEWLIHKGPVAMCQSGLHASERIVYALLYAPGLTVCRVTCRNIVDAEEDKFVCRERRIDWRITDADDLFRAFACKVALSVIHMCNLLPTIVKKSLRTGDKADAIAARKVMLQKMSSIPNAAEDSIWAALNTIIQTDPWNNVWFAVNNASWAIATNNYQLMHHKQNRDGSAKKNVLMNFNTLLEQMVMEAKDK